MSTEIETSDDYKMTPIYNYLISLAYWLPNIEAIPILLLCHL